MLKNPVLAWKSTIVVSVLTIQLLVGRTSQHRAYTRAAVLAKNHRIAREGDRRQNHPTTRHK